MLPLLPLYASQEPRFRRQLDLKHSRKRHCATRPKKSTSPGSDTRSGRGSSSHSMSLTKRTPVHKKLLHLAVRTRRAACSDSTFKTMPKSVQNHHTINARPNLESYQQAPSNIGHHGHHHGHARLPPRRRVHDIDSQNPLFAAVPLSESQTFQHITLSTHGLACAVCGRPAFERAPVRVQHVRPWRSVNIEGHVSGTKYRLHPEPDSNFGVV